LQSFLDVELNVEELARRLAICAEPLRALTTRLLGKSWERVVTGRVVTAHEVLEGYSDLSHFLIMK